MVEVRESNITVPSLFLLTFLFSSCSSSNSVFSSVIAIVITDRLSSGVNVYFKRLFLQNQQTDFNQFDKKHLWGMAIKFGENYGLAPNGAQ